jgi:exodeoxyribonuclease V alpha subunit
MEDLTLAYAVTIHKSQGSEYPAVVLMLGNEHFVMLNRPLLYTALTRGKQMVALVGSRKALQRAVQNDQPTERYANLDQRLRQALR